MHAYLDESIRAREYILCAVLVSESTVAAVRQSLRGQLRGRQSRLHMAKESNETKKRLIAHVSGLNEIAAVVTITSSGRSDREARDDCLSAITAHLMGFDVRRIVVESCDQDLRDRQIVGDALAAVGRVARVEIVHHRASDEPLLWLPDIVAWAFGKSAAWKSRISRIQIHEIRI